MENGSTTADIARRHNVSQTTARVWLHKEGIALPTRSKNPEKKELERLYLEEGQTQKEIASAYGVSKETVYEWIHKAGIKKALGKGQGQPESPGKDILSRLVSEGTSLKGIADRYGVSRSVADRWFRKDRLP